MGYLMGTGEEMKLKDIRFKLTDPATNESIVFGFDDLYGYEGEECGVFISTQILKRNSNFNYDTICNNSGYGFNGIPFEVGNLEIEVLENNNEN